MAVIVESPVIEAPCTEMWADPGDVADLLGGEITAAEAEEATIEATYFLWSLSGYKYHGWQTWTEDYLLPPGQSEFTLAKGPVDTVLAISQLESTSTTGDSSTLEGWTWDGSYVRLGTCTSPFFSDPFGCFPCNGETRIRVTYRLKPNLPPGAARVTKRLATEFYNASVGAPCSLPERIQTVNRQGVSWTLLDPQDFLILGRIGIGQVDGWLAMLSRFGITRTIDTYYSPVVLYSEIVSCTEPT